MNITTKKYSPTRYECKWKPHFDPVKNEILECECGLNLSWFQMEKVVTETVCTYGKHYVVLSTLEH